MHLTAYSGWVLDLRERQATFDILYDAHAKDLPDVRISEPRPIGV